MAPTFSLSTRSSGILLHPTSLPGPFQIGDIGPEAYRFADFLSSTHQTWWQMFPIGPAGYGGSPYQPLSAFAGSPLLISPELLYRDGLLTKSDLLKASEQSTDKVNFHRASFLKSRLLKTAFSAFQSAGSASRNELNEFIEKNKSWLDDYALFCVLKEKHRKAPWYKWERPYRSRRSRAVQSAGKSFGISIQYHQFLQYQFFKQWYSLKKYCHQKQVALIGDIPIFVSHDSVDVWAHPNLFTIDSQGLPIYIAGTPPDYFSRTGQRWGNPLYRWDILKKTGYRWWVERFRMMFEHFDAVRLDHFIGFERYWRIPGGHKDARHGKWIPGPKSHFFKKVVSKLGKLEIIAEDLGVVTDRVRALRDKFGFPGMKVLQFAFGGESDANGHIPHNYPQRCIVYTGTHDNDTTVGWFRDRGGKSSTRSGNQIRKETEYAKKYMNTDGKEIHWDMIRLAHMSVAELAIVPVQDLLGLGSEARMNTPGTHHGNWLWRLKIGALDSRVSNRLRKITLTYARGSKSQ